jgi:acetyltransferase-like isoleucine patch superfamily enzyme
VIDALRRAVIRQIQVRLWGMDIHPSAKIAPSALIDRTWPRGVHIAEGCVIDEEAVVLTHDMTRGIYMDTRIGARCRLGARAIIMPGVTIGEDCIVAPGAVVIRDVPPGSIATGNPATVASRDAGGAT